MKSRDAGDRFSRTTRRIGLAVMAAFIGFCLSACTALRNSAKQDVPNQTMNADERDRVPQPTGSEVAILTVRQDNIRHKTHAELLPMARLRGNRYAAFASDPGDGSTCPNLDFAGWLKPGPRYQVLSGGKVIGYAESSKRALGWYDCSQLCVVAAKTDVTSASGGRKDSRLGWSVTGDFDEKLSQFVVVSGSFTGFPTAPVENVPSNLNAALRTIARTLLPKDDHGPDKSLDLTLDEVHSFFSRPHADIHTFVTASLRKGEDRYETVTAIVKVVDGKQPEPIFKSGVVEPASDERGSYHEFVDAVDLDGDGQAEVVAIYHNYEYHCYCILHFDGTRYKVVHKGPEYGC